MLQCVVLKGLCRGGSGRYEAFEATVPYEELGEWTSEGILLLSVAVDALVVRGRRVPLA